MKLPRTFDSLAALRKLHERRPSGNHFYGEHLGTDRGMRLMNGRFVLVTLREPDRTTVYVARSDASHHPLTSLPGPWRDASMFVEYAKSLPVCRRCELPITLTPDRAVFGSDNDVSCVNLWTAVRYAQHEPVELGTEIGCPACDSTVPHVPAGATCPAGTSYARRNSAVFNPDPGKE